MGGTILFSLLYIISVQPASLAQRFGERAYAWCGYIRMVSMLFEMSAVAGYILFVFGDRYNYILMKQHHLVIQVTGLVVTVLSLGFMFYAAWVAGKEAALPAMEHQLYQGIYNYMRHPQTLGEMVSWFGVAMVLNSLTLLVYSLVWIPLFIGYTVLEDNDLALRFGQEYIDYTKRVGLFWKKR